MGYRFILRRLEYLHVVHRGQMMPVHMWWLNAGVAPAYRDTRRTNKTRLGSLELQRFRIED